jgi:hypothetical protein
MIETMYLRTVMKALDADSSFSSPSEPASHSRHTTARSYYMNTIDRNSTYLNFQKGELRIES